MKRFFIVLVTITLITTANATNDENFYLQTKNAPQKLLPNTLKIVMFTGETQRVFVTPQPNDADTDALSWELSANRSIASITWEGVLCTIHAKEPGTGILTVSDSNGAAASIQVTIKSAIDYSISLSPDSTSIFTGESMMIHAKISPQDALVIWNVQGGDHAAVSYGGELCKIKGLAPGDVHVRAKIAGTEIAADMTLHIETHQIDNIILFQNIIKSLVIGASLLLLFSLTLWLTSRKKS